jgi:hypothetical protein
MIFFGLFKTKKDLAKEEREREERAAQEEADRRADKERSARRQRAAAQVMASLAAARHARAKQEEAEADACATIGLSRASTDTKVRKVKAASDQISGVFNPVDGKTAAEMAQEAYDAEHGAASS